MSLSSLLRILLARWWMIALVVVVCVGVVSVASMLMPRQYSASMDLIMEGRVQDRVTGATVSSTSGYMSTQSDIVRSRRVASQVYDYLEPDIREKVDARAAEEAEGEPNPAGWLTGYIMSNLSVTTTRDNNVMTVSLSGDDPEIAAGALNSLSGAYIDISIELRTDPARRFSKWYQGQLELLRGNLSEARRELSGFQQEHGIVGVSEQLDLESSRLANLSAMLVQAQDEATQDQLRQGSEGRIAPVPDNTVTQGLRTELARAQAQLQDLSTRYGERHPEYRQKSSEVAALRDSLERERGIVAQGLRSTAEVSGSRRAELEEEFQKQKQEVLDLKAKRDELDLLQQEVEMAQEAYNAAAGQASANTLESRLAETSVTVLNEAAPPTLPSSPNVKLNVVIATVLGFLLGIALSLLLEVSNRRVRSRSDIEDTLGLPVLAYLPDTPGARQYREAQTV